MDACGSACGQKCCDSRKAMPRSPHPRSPAEGLGPCAKARAGSAPHPAFEGRALDVHHQAPIQCETSDGRKMVASQGNVQHRRLSHEAEVRTAMGNREKPASSPKTIVRSSSLAFCCHATTWWARHTWMACSSRWLARTSGFCRLCVMAERRRPPWVG
jgi:hypothetical protein